MLGYIYMINGIKVYVTHAYGIINVIYIYGVFRVNPSLTCLSCRSSPVITDKGIASLIPCMSTSNIGMYTMHNQYILVPVQ